jgi:hypothetical protein
VEKIADMYVEFEAEELRRKSKITIAYKIRTFVTNVSDYLQNKRLQFDAVYRVANERHLHTQPLDKSYFKKIVSEAWNIEVDERGIVWIRVDQPRK